MKKSRIFLAIFLFGIVIGVAITIVSFENTTVKVHKGQMTMQELVYIRAMDDIRVNGEKKH